MNLSSNFSAAILDPNEHVFTLKEYLEYGDLLHINTAIDIFVNSIAAYIILMHSTKAMGAYKYYILSSIIIAFLLDFHSTFIFGPFVMLPTSIMCGSGIVSRHLNWFWGQVLQYALMHIGISAVGWSIIWSLLYQYYQLKGNTDFFRSFFGIFSLIIISITYTFPSLLFIYVRIDYSESLEYVKKYSPNSYSLFLQAPCYGLTMDKMGLAHHCSQFIQIFTVVAIFFFIAFKIQKKLSEMKHVLSAATLKARKQFLLALFLQITIPTILVVGPIAITVVSALFKIKQMSFFSKLFVPIFAFHSCANATVVLLVITPYRQTLYRWIKKIIRIKSNTVTVTSQIPKISMTSRSLHIPSIQHQSDLRRPSQQLTVPFPSLRRQSLT